MQHKRHRNLTAAALVAGALLGLAACSSGSSRPVDAPAPTATVTQTPAAPDAGNLEAKRPAVLAALRDVNSRLAGNETQAMTDAIKQCAALDSGAPNPDHLAAQRFAHDGITLTDDDGAHIDIGLRNSLCPD